MSKGVFSGKSGFCITSKSLFFLAGIVGLSGLAAYLLFEPSNLVGNLLQSSAVILATIASVRLYFFERKLGGALLSNSLVLVAGLSLTSLGYILYGVLEEILPELPSVGVYDIFWISGYALVTLFLVCEFIPIFDAVSGRTSPAKKVLVFCGMVALSVALLLFLVPELSVSDWDWLSKAAVASYLIFDAVILAMLLGLASYTRGGLFFKINLILFLGFLIILVSDISYYNEIIRGTYSTGNLNALGWIFGYLLLCVATTFKLKILKGV